MAQDNSNSNVRRCGQVGEGEEDHLSMIDVLNEQARLQADADAVLGGSDEYNCTYPKGYLNRQALYACATCTPEGNAGICLACSYACHEGHDIYELYTKRNFKCDCGNEKFKGNACQIDKEKKELNSRNRYNQNFRGLYCTCSRPYPDEDDPVEDEMIQCIMCEDWHHGRHLNTDVPDSSDYHEMICAGCMGRYSFLWAYHVQCDVTSVAKAEESEENIKVDVSPTQAKEDTTNSVHEPSCSSSPTSRKSEKRKGNSQDTEKNGGPSPKKLKTEEDVDQPGSSCLLKSLQLRAFDEPDCAAFWSEGWRAKLCTCSDCREMYQDRNIDFLIDESDTMQAYEEKGCEATREAEAQDEADSQAFNAMGRVQQIEIVRGVTDLKTELNEFLQGFVREGKVVKESDIREFFQRMDERRRERMQTSQNNCR